jgi:hypothetical protein
MFDASSYLLLMSAHGIHMYLLHGRLSVRFTGREEEMIPVIHICQTAGLASLIHYYLPEAKSGLP